MSILNFARLVVYRFHEKGLEVFLLNTDLNKDPDVWKFPECDMIKLSEEMNHEDYIELDVNPQELNAGKIIAIEGDWHTIPSIRGLIKHDVKVVKSIVKEAIPGIEKGAFVGFKETVKKLLPHEYKAIKELKEILVDRNLLRNI